MSPRPRHRHALLLAACVLPLVLLAPTVRADPLAMRHGGEGPRLALGGPVLSAAAPIGAGWHAAASWRLPADSVSAWIGRRHGLAGGQRGWFLDAWWAGGLAAPLVRPGVALGIHGAMQGGWRCDGFAHTWTLAAPVLVGWAGGVAARLPLTAEVELRWRIYSAWVGVQAGIGAVTSPGLDTAITGNVALVLAR